MRDEDIGGLAELLSHQGRTNPSSIAFATPERQLTFAELAERAAARAMALRGQGVRAGDRIGVAMGHGLPLIEVFWGVVLLGGVPCVYNPSVPAGTLARRLALIRPRLVVTDEVATGLRAPGEPPEHTSFPDDLAFLQLTSGTSGAPRASMILQRNVMGYLRLNRTDGWLRADDVMVSWVPPWHDLGLMRFVISPVFHGIRCHIVAPAVKTIPEWLRTIAEVRGTYSAAPDFALRLAPRMVRQGQLDLSSLRFLKSGGEPVRASTREEFENHFAVPGRVVPGYGLGEATLGVTEHLPGEEIPVDARGHVSCGPANDGLEVRAGRGLDAPEEILVRGESIFAGYFEAPEETGRVLRDGWLHTGDSGYLDDQGRLFVLGRRAGMIKRGGALIAPRELEEAAQRVTGVHLAAACSTHAGQDETVVVAVEAEATAGRSTEEIASGVSQEILDALGFAPGRVVILPRRSIPRTENGKIRHARLRALLESGPA